MTAGVATQRRGPGKYRLFGNNQHVIHQGDAHTEYQSALVAEGLDRGLTWAQIFLVHGGRVMLSRNCVTDDALEKWPHKGATSASLLGS